MHPYIHTCIHTGAHNCCWYLNENKAVKTQLFSSTQLRYIYLSHWCFIALLFLTVAGGGSCRSCHTSGQAKVTGDRGYLASIVTMETQDDEGCGSSRCPWLIQVPAGQGINLTLIDFTAGNQQLQPQPTSPQQRPGMPSSDRCSRLLVVKERANPKDSQICGGRVRWKHIHLSVSHFVEVHVVGQDVLNGKGQFLVYYEGLLQGVHCCYFV